MFPLGHHVFNLHVRIIRAFNRDAALVLVVLAKADIAVDFRDDGVVFGATCLKEFGHTRQTTGNVLGLGTFTRDTRDDVTGLNLRLVFDRKNRIDRHRIGHRVARIVADRFAIFTHQDDLGLELVALGGRAPVDHDLLGHAGGFVGVFLDRDARHQVDVFGRTGFLGNDRQGVRVPFEQLVTARHVVAFFDVQLGAVADLVAGPLLTILIDDQQLHVPAHDEHFTGAVFKRLCVLESDLARLAGLKEGLLTTLRNTADVEGPHRQLCTGFTNRLGRDDADGLTLVDQRTACEVTAIAHGADALFGITGQRAADPCGLHASLVDGIRHALVDQRACGHQNILGAGHQNIVRRNTAQQTLGQRGDNLTIVDSRFGGDRGFGAAVMLAHDAVLRHVHQTACQVTGVRRLQSGIRQTFPRTVGRVEVLENGQTFFKVRDNRRLDDVAVRLRHQAAHPAQLFHLRDRATGTGVGHHVDRVRLFLGTVLMVSHGGDGAHHRLGHLVVTLRPCIDDLVVLFALSDQAVHILLFKVLHLLAGFFNQRPFGVGNQHVVFAEGDARFESFAETHGHDLVTEDDRLFLTAVTVDGVDDLLHFFLAQQTVDQIKRRFGVQRQKRTKTDTTGGRVKAHHHFVAFSVDLFDPRLDFRVQVNRTGVEGVLHLVDGAEDHAFANHAFTLKGRVVETQDHILRRYDDRRAVCRRQNVVRGHHQNTRFQLGFQRERDVNGHLVTVEVGVEGRADQRVQLDRLAFDQDGFKRLNAKTVQRRRAVEHDGVFTDHLIKNVPNLRALFLDQLLGLLNCGGQTFGFKPRVDERLEQFERHLLGQTTLMQLQLRAGHNDRTT